MILRVGVVCRKDEVLYVAGRGVSDSKLRRGVRSKEWRDIRLQYKVEPSQTS